MNDYEWAKRTKFLLAVIYGSLRRHSNSSKTVTFVVSSVDVILASLGAERRQPLGWLYACWLQKFHTRRCSKFFFQPCFYYCRIKMFWIKMMSTLTWWIDSFKQRIAIHVNWCVSINILGRIVICPGQNIRENVSVLHERKMCLVEMMFWKDLVR